MKPRKNHIPGFKTKVVLKALQKRESIQEIGKKYEIHPNQISTCFRLIDCKVDRPMFTPSVKGRWRVLRVKNNIEMPSTRLF